SRVAAGFTPLVCWCLVTPSPGIWHVPIKLAWIQPMDDAPSAPAKSYSLLTLAGSQAARPLADDVIDSVRAYRGNGSYLPVTNPIAFLSYDVADQQHGALVVGPGPRSDFFKVSLALLVLAEEPIYRSVGDNTSSSDLAALALRVPLVEERIQGCGSASISVFTAGGVV